MHRFLRRAFVVFTLLALLAPAGIAAAAELKGTVKDKTGGAVADAQVIVLTPQRAVVATVTTDKAGQFTVSGLADGQYQVAAEGLIKDLGIEGRVTAQEVKSLGRFLTAEAKKTMADLETLKDASGGKVSGLVIFAACCSELKTSLAQLAQLMDEFAAKA